MQNSENYVIRNTSKLNGYISFDIEQKNLIYSDLINFHGSQSMHVGEKGEIITNLCSEVVKLMRKIEFYNNWSNDEIKDLFAKNFKLKFVNWIEPNIADFRFFVFSLEQMIHSLSFLYDFEKIILEFPPDNCPKCQSNEVYRNHVKEYKECNACEYRWY